MGKYYHKGHFVEGPKISQFSFRRIESRYFRLNILEHYCRIFFAYQRFLFIKYYKIFIKYKKYYLKNI